MASQHDPSTPQAGAPQPGVPLQREQLLALTRDALRTLEAGSIVVSDTSRSMVPLLWGGERLHWIRAARSPGRGALVIYLQSPGPIVHRVVWRRAAGGWCTKGDGRGGFDVQPVLPDELLGSVQRIERAGESFRLDTGGARCYAQLASAVSIAGGAAYAVALCGDRALGRILGRTVPHLLQVPAWWISRGGQLALHKLLFRICHRFEPCPAPEVTSPLTPRGESR